MYVALFLWLATAREEREWYFSKVLQILRPRRVGLNI
jgi:hypothetical protein